MKKSRQEYEGSLTGYHHKRKQVQHKEINIIYCLLLTDEGRKNRGKSKKHFLLSSFLLSMSSLQIAVLSQLIDCSCTGPTLQALSQHSPHWWQLPQPSCCFMGHSPQVAAPDQDCSSGGTHSHTSSCPLDSFQLSSSELSTEEMNVTFRSHHKRSKARPINFFLFHFINLEFTGNLSSET